MINKNLMPRPFWRSELSYVLVTTGAVIGLGNVFLFPYYAAKHGAVFVLLTFLFIILFSVPVLLAELLIGQRARQNPVGAMSVLAMENTASQHWKKVGWLCFIIVSVLLVFYIIQVAFPLSYLISTVKNIIYPDLAFHNNAASLQPEFLIISLVLLMVATFIVIARGINRGLEEISCVIVPLFFIGLFSLAIYACVMGDFKNALYYLFNINSHDFNIIIIKDALIYAFFTLNIGMGVMMVYGSYLPGTVRLGSSALIVAGLDMLASLLSYFIIYPLWLVNSHDVMPTSPLNYDVITHLFSSSSMSNCLCATFLLVMVLGAWTAIIAMAEAVTTILKECFDLSRVLSAGMVMGVIGLVGFYFIIFNDTSITIPNFHWSFNISLIEKIAENVLAPLSGLLIAIFAGWVIKKKISYDELGFNPKIYNLWLTCIRFVTPVGIMLLFWCTFY